MTIEEQLEAVDDILTDEEKDKIIEFENNKEDKKGKLVGSSKIDFVANLVGIGAAFVGSGYVARISSNFFDTFDENPEVKSHKIAKWIVCSVITGTASIKIEDYIKYSIIEGYDGFLELKHSINNMLKKEDNDG